MTCPTYADCLQELFKLQRFGIKLGLDVIGHILKSLDQPHTRFLSIHIAGTNGKGSVAAMLTAILSNAGYTVGTYTSPHLERFNERIAIDNIPIEDDDVVRAYLKVKSVENLSRTPTFFEFATAMAFYEFGRRNVQWAVVETGMGGRLDATNILNPELSIITNISLEHQAYLGSSLHAIAGEKAGIIKYGIPIVTGIHQKPAISAIKEKALQSSAPLIRYREAFFSRRRRDSVGFDYIGLQHTMRRIELNLQGDHQIQNASLALAACELLEQSGKVHIPEDVIRCSLKQTRWPGRLEVASYHPYILLDGAHNMMSARALSRFLSTRFDKHRLTLVIGILDDKPFRSILRDLTSPCHRIVVTQPKISRAIPVDRLSEYVREMGLEPHVAGNVDEAVRYAVQTSKPDEVICIAGSLYVVGEAKTALSKMGLTAAGDAADASLQTAV